MEGSNFFEAQIILAIVTIIGATGNIFYGIRMNGGRYWKLKYEELLETLQEVKKNKDNYKRNYNALLKDYSELKGEHTACKHFDTLRYRDHQPLA